MGIGEEPIIPLSNGRVVNLEDEMYFIHNQPKNKLPIRIFINPGGSDKLTSTVGTLAQNNLQDGSRRGSLMMKKKNDTQQTNWSQMDTSWIGS